MNRSGSIKRMVTLLLRFLGVLFETAVYAFMWFEYFYPVINNSNRGLKFYINGHILILAIYAVLLMAFIGTYGGMKIGYLKPIDIIISQIMSTLIVNIVTYLQLSLMNNWLLAVGRFFIMLLLQAVCVVVWTLICDKLYHLIYPPREVLLIHGTRPYQDIVDKLDSRGDKFNVSRRVNIAEGLDEVKRVIDDGIRTVLLWDIPTADRNELLKYCYSKSVRIYMMPKISDVIIKGSEQVHLFDTPLYLTRDTAMTAEQRMIKRIMDVVLSLLLIVITSPIMLITAICIKLHDRGPILYRQVRCTAGGREFKILKFRSMRVDAEKDGVARLAAKNDDRITPIGHFIRKVRIDELPQLFNILVGEMSFIGPRPERPEIIAQYIEEMPEFVFRMKAKAGLAGYAQVYGKYNTTPYDKLKLDLTYIENYTVWLDLKLMLLTLKILIKPESTEGIAVGQTTAMKNSKQDEN